MLKSNFSTKNLIILYELNNFIRNIKFL